MTSDSHIPYVMITPARNEEAYIEKTIQSMIAQTVLPKKWIIVSDGSTDRTDDIVQKYASGFDWIDFLRMPDHEDRQFAAKVHCFNAGYRKVADMNFEVIGNLDADLSFESDYLRYLLERFIQYPDLGVAGTPFTEDDRSQYDFRFTNIQHVSGACQLFRKNCFEAIGGYQPIKGGGIDWVAVTTARMKGWRTQTFTGKTIFHHRKIGTGKGNVISAIFRQGQQDYSMGYHPLWEYLRALYQMKQKPYIVSGLMLLAGFAVSSLSRQARPISKELVAFIRQEQMSRLSRKVHL